MKHTRQNSMKHSHNLRISMFMLSGEFYLAHLLWYGIIIEDDKDLSFLAIEIYIISKKPQWEVKVTKNKIIRNFNSQKHSKYRWSIFRGIFFKWNTIIWSSTWLQGFGIFLLFDYIQYEVLACNSFCIKYNPHTLSE